VLYLFWASKSYPKLPRKPKSGPLSYLPLLSPMSRPGGIPTKKQKKEKKKAKTKKLERNVKNMVMVYLTREIYLHS
jgi:hypothetical protein